MKPIEASPFPTVPRPTREPGIAEAARALEAGFLTVMLKEAGLAMPRSAFGGGSGEDQFASFLIEAYAGKIVEGGGIGLAERLVLAMTGEADARR